MTVHLIKLSVGSESIDDLAAWQAQRLAEQKAQGLPQELVHVTRHMPKRASEVLDGGSIYWVIKGWIVARQKMTELRPIDKDGVTYCGLVHDPLLVPVEGRPRRAFQGWRYLEAVDAPPDRLGADVEGEMPEHMRRELRALGLL